MRKQIHILFLALLLLTACTGLRVRKDYLKPLDHSFSGTFQNKAFKAKGRTIGYGSPSLLELLEIFHVPADSVSMRFSEGVLLVSYADSTALKTKSFSGRWSKKGYFEIWLRKKKIEIPPFVPIIYSNVDINRIRIGISAQGDLIVDNKWDRSGNILILGAGSMGRRQSFFRPRPAITLN